jgi:hypothetical protein
MSTRKDFEMHEITFENLERQWVTHSDKFEDYAFGAVDARRAHSRAHAAVKTAKAEAAADMRSNPEKWEAHKVTTDKGLELAINIHPKVVKAVEAEIEAKYQLDLWDAAVETMYQRKSTLEALAELRGSARRATPRATEETADELNEQGKRQQYSKLRVDAPRRGK